MDRTGWQPEGRTKPKKLWPIPQTLGQSARPVDRSRRRRFRKSTAVPPLDRITKVIKSDQTISTLIPVDPSSRKQYKKQNEVAILCSFLVNQRPQRANDLELPARNSAIYAIYNGVLSGVRSNGFWLLLFLTSWNLVHIRRILPISCSPLSKQVTNHVRLLT